MFADAVDRVMPRSPTITITSDTRSSGFDGRGQRAPADGGDCILPAIEYWLMDRLEHRAAQRQRDRAIVISMRKCNDREKAIYQERFGAGLMPIASPRQNTDEAPQYCTEARCLTVRRLRLR